MSTSGGRRVVVVGGGNAALCAAIAAVDGGAQVTLFERAAKPFRGGNTRHTRNLRTVHTGADGFVTGPYLHDEFMADLVGVTGEEINRDLAELTIAESASITEWMAARGARWQAPLKGTLGLARTNHFFLGGGKSLLNAWYLTAVDRGVEVHYETSVVGLDIDDRRVRGVRTASDDGQGERLVAADAVVVAAGGFEANRQWLAKYWGDAAYNFIVRGTANNDGTMLRLLLDAGARSVGDPKGVHAIAVDARAPAFDAGIITRLDAVPIGIAVNVDAERFHDEGEDIWPKRYATWGRLIIEQPDQRAFALFDAKVAGETIPGLYPPFVGATIAELAVELGLEPARLDATVAAFNDACQPGCRFDLAEKDGCGTTGLRPPKSHWARPLDTPPFYGYPLRPGITFTYLGVEVDATARIQADGGRFENLFAAGEIMSGNILIRGYLAGFGMTIGSVWGRIAGREAARA
jgi:tricarballylate dehydrogenase